ncbi:MAG TPA: CDC48 family AAA ATPase [Nitrososphaeraceae archaeon]|nr:CDC48 family AAA ATPase [Nitrososphaeraceae archaeon]
MNNNYPNFDGNNNNKFILKIAETFSKFVGRGIALIDPKTIEEYGLRTGDVLELTHESTSKKSYVLLWSSNSNDYGKGLIRIDGYTRENISVGIDDQITVQKVNVEKAEEIEMSPTVDLNIVGLENYMSEKLDGRVVAKDDVLLFNIMGKRIGFIIISTKPQNQALLINSHTKFKLGTTSDIPVQDKKIDRITYEDIGGIKNEVQKVREIIELPLRHPELFDKIGIDAPKGVLLHGPPGTGKTLLAKAVANETNANFYSIGGPEIMSKFYGESEEKLRNIFLQAQDKAPSIIFIDEIDSIAPKRDEVSGDVEKRIVSQLLTLMDGLKTRGKVVVIAATNRPNAIDQALRRPGRFDREIEIGIPDEEGRYDILQIHTRGMPLEQDLDLKYYAKVTHGFVGADLEMVAKEAAMRSLRRIIPEINLKESKIPIDILNKIKITSQDLDDALKEVHPSAMREVLVQKPNIQWKDIGGLDNLKEELKEAIEWPLKHADLFIKAAIKPPKGILLYGPPGTGKTLLAKAVASTSESNFISIKGPELLSKWVGESEKGVREIFRKARQAAPCVIFFDEIDAIAPTRSGSDGGDSHVTERLVSQMLTEIDGLDDLKGVVIIGATNRPDIIDKALLRPGRFDRLLEIPIPDNYTRKQILQVHLKKKPLGADVNIDKLVELTDSFTGAEIESLVNAAAIAAVKEHVIIREQKEQNKNQKTDTSKTNTSKTQEEIKENKTIEELEISMKHFESSFGKFAKKNKPSLPRISSIA